MKNRNIKYSDLSDSELLARFSATHDNELLGILLERYTLMLFGVCMKYFRNEEEAKDGVQQIFLKVIQELGKYKIEFFKSWVYMVAKNHCLMKLRNKQNFVAIEPGSEVLSEPGSEPDKGAMAAHEKTLDLLETGLQELNEEQKRCVTMFYLERKSYKQISDTTGYTMMQVKSYIQNGKRNLRNLVEEKLRFSRNEG